MSMIDYYAGDIWAAENLYEYVWANTGGGSVPYIVINIFHLSADLRLYVVPANTTFVPDHYGYDRNFKYDYRPSNDTPSTSFLGTPTYGLANQYLMLEPQDGWLGWFAMTVSRDDEDAPVQLSNNADYRLLMGILRWGGDPEKKESWETYLSPVVRYKPE